MVVCTKCPSYGGARAPPPPRQICINTRLVTWLTLVRDTAHILRDTAASTLLAHGGSAVVSRVGISVATQCANSPVYRAPVWRRPHGPRALGQNRSNLQPSYAGPRNSAILRLNHSSFLQAQWGRQETKASKFKLKRPSYPTLNDDDTSTCGPRTL